MIELLTAAALYGLPMRYLIGTDNPVQQQGTLLVASYDSTATYKSPAVKYVNLFDENGTGKLGPYLHNSDTAKQYGEGQIDPRGPGWVKNLHAQFKRAVAQGFQIVELDNPDAYEWRDVLGAIELAQQYRLRVLAKNPLLVRNSGSKFLGHPNVIGAIVEEDAGTPLRMQMARCQAGRPGLPVWFVSFGKDGWRWAQNLAPQAKQFDNMGVTWSSKGEYGSARDIVRPRFGTGSCFGVEE